MEVAHERVVPIGSNQIEIGLNIVVSVERSPRAVPMPRAIKEDIDFGGKLESILGEELEGDLGSKEIAGTIGGIKRRCRHKLIGEVIVENSRPGVGRAFENFFTLGIRKERVGQFKHVWNLSFEGWLMIPNLGIKLVAGIDGIREDVVVVTHVKGDGRADLL